MDIGEVERAIAQLEAGHASYASVSKLADLYAVRDHARGRKGYERSYSAAPPPASLVQLHGESDFLRAVAGKDQEGVFAILNELMTTLSMTSPRAYDSVMRRLQRL